jgi:uncharacterized protein (TIGR03435 family)
MHGGRVAATIMMGVALSAAAQSQPAGAAKQTEFDVASLKAVPPSTGSYRANLGVTRHGQVSLGNVTLSDCLRFAYGFASDSQVIGPDWIRSRDVRFDITAKADPDTPESQLLIMLQNLLSERLKLALHRDQRTLPFLALTTGKKGVKLQESESASNASGTTLTPGLIRTSRMTMPILAMLLSRFMREPVVDLTELKGIYAVNLEWAPDPLRAGNQHEAGDARGTAELSSGVSIYTALQNQLGLKLESRKGPLDVIVVDSAQQIPIEN